MLLSVFYKILSSQFKTAKIFPFLLREVSGNILELMSNTSEGYQNSVDKTNALFLW